ncbi:MAG: nitroreductase family protein [Oscillospiraceae bacterium]|nr:nitroreductase family protein [Oscillospiraceae bacterium]
MDTMQAIFGRYSYRGMYKPEPVPRETLKKIMEAGLAAPSGCNTQTTSLIGLDDARLIGAVSASLDSPHFASAPAAVCVLTQRIPGYADVYFNVQDYAAAIENILLAVTELGYASCWIEGQVTGDAKTQADMAAALGVPDGYEVVAYLPIGVPAKDGPRASKKPFESRAWFNGYGK